MAARKRKNGSEHRKQARELRKQGLTLGEIADRLGVAKQIVHSWLGHAAGPRPIACRNCGVLIMEGHQAMGNIKTRPVCLACLEKMPEAPFGERLRAVRIARGLTQQQVADAVGLTVITIRNYEQQVIDTPKWASLMKLLRLLGPELIGLS